MKASVICIFALSMSTGGLASPASNVNLGSAAAFGVLGGSTVTNTGPSNILGNVGVWSGADIIGFPPSSVAGVIDAGGSLSMQAQSDLTVAYNFAAGQACSGGNVLTGQDLGGLTLEAGVYCFSSSAQLTGTLTLDTQGDANAVFVFQIGSTLTTASNSAVIFENDNLSANLFWQVGSSATLGTATAFAGNILAFTSITLTTDTSIQCGRALASNGAVTLDTNTVDTGSCQAAGVTPEPATAPLMALSILIGLILYARRSVTKQTQHARRYQGPTKRA